MNKILVIEPDINIQKILEYDLKMQNYCVDICGDFKDIIQFIKENNYDLIILECDNVDGIDLIKKIRGINNNVKIFILSSDDDEMNIILGLQSGANDYISKPFSPRILLAKIQVAFRDLNYDNKVTKINVNSNLIIDLERVVAIYNKQEIELSKIEFELINFFAENRNKVVTRNDIMKRIWAYDFDDNNRIIDVYVHSLRKKLFLKEQLLSKRGLGYILQDI